MHATRSRAGTLLPVLLLTLLALSPPAFSSAIDWLSYTAGGQGQVSTYLEDGAVVVDDQGGTYTVNTIRASVDTILITHLDPSGNRVWQSKFGLPSSAALITLGPDTSVFVAGVFKNNSSADSYLLLKYDGQSGVQLWERRISAGVSDARPQYLRVDAAGNVLMAGNTANQSQPLLVKLRGDNGDIDWTRTSFGPAGSEPRLAGMVLTANGDPVAVNDSFVTRYARSDGAPIWTANLSTGNYVQALRNAPSGALFVLGSKVTSNTLSLARLNPDSGQVDWEVTRNLASGIDSFRDAAIDSMGDIVVLGRDSGGQVYVSKLSGDDAQPLWTRMPTEIPRHATAALALDDTGRPLLASQYPTPGILDLRLLAADTGADLWHQVADDLFLFGGSITAAALPNGTALVGVNSQIDGRLAMNLRAHSLADGQLSWTASEGEVDGIDETLACDDPIRGNRAALDAAGNTYVISCSSTYIRQITVTRFDVSGQRQWRRHLPMSVYSGNSLCCIRLAGGNGLLVGAAAYPALVLFRLDRDSGSLNWTRSYDYLPPGSLGDGMRELRVDGTGSSAVIAGSTRLLKVDTATGDVIWSVPASMTSFVLGGSGDIYTVGSALGGNNTLDLSWERRSGVDGALMWQQSLDGFDQQDTGVGVAIDPFQHLYLLAASADSSGRMDFLTVRADPTNGAALWSRRMDFSFNIDRPDKLATTGDGGVVVSGVARNNGPSVIATMEYDADGTLSFVNTIAANYSDDSRVLDLMVDGDRVHLSGWIYRPGQLSSNFLLASIDRSSGSGTGMLDLDFGLQKHDAATDILPLPNGRLRVAGNVWTASGQRMVVTEVNTEVLLRSGFEHPF